MMTIAPDKNTAGDDITLELSRAGMTLSSFDGRTSMMTAIAALGAANEIPGCSKSRLSQHKAQHAGHKDTQQQRRNSLLLGAFLNIRPKANSTRKPELIKP